MKLRRRIIFLFLAIFFHTRFCFSQGSSSSVRMDFRNQKITDILYALSSLCGIPLIADDTVTGNATFRFEDKDFESALERFATVNKLFVEKKDECFYVSRVKGSYENGLLTMEV